MYSKLSWFLKLGTLDYMQFLKGICIMKFELQSKSEASSNFMYAAAGQKMQLWHWIFFKAAAD